MIDAVLGIFNVWPWTVPAGTEFLWLFLIGGSVVVASTALFHANHGNLYTTTNAGAPTVLTLNAMYTATAVNVTAGKRQSNLVSRMNATRLNSRITGMIENSM